MTTAVVLTIPVERIEWGPVLRVGEHSCMQVAKLYQADATVLSLMLQWPTPEPTLAVLSQAVPRHGGERD